MFASIALPLRYRIGPLDPVIPGALDCVRYSPQSM